MKTWVVYTLVNAVLENYPSIPHQSQHLKVSMSHLMGCQIFRGVLTELLFSPGVLTSWDPTYNSACSLTLWMELLRLKSGANAEVPRSWASRGWHHWFQKEAWLYLSLWENDPTSDLMFNLRKLFWSDFMFSIPSVFVLTKQDINFVNCGYLFRLK